MLFCGQQLKIFNLVIRLIKIYVVNMIPLWNPAVMAFPHIYVQSFVSLGIQIIPCAFIPAERKSFVIRNVTILPVFDHVIILTILSDAVSSSALT